QPRAGRPGPVDLDQQLRQVHALRQVGVLDTVQLEQFLVEDARDGAAGVVIAAVDLHLDRGDGTGVEEAADHAAGLDEEIVRLPVVFQLAPQPRDVGGRGRGTTVKTRTQLHAQEGSVRAVVGRVD